MGSILTAKPSIARLFVGTHRFFLSFASAILHNQPNLLNTLREMETHGSATISDDYRVLVFERKPEPVRRSTGWSFGPETAATSVCLFLFCLRPAASRAEATYFKRYTEQLARMLFHALWSKRSNHTEVSPPFSIIRLYNVARRHALSLSPARDPTIDGGVTGRWESLSDRRLPFPHLLLLRRKCIHSDT